MGAVLATIWAFAQSKEGVALIGAGLGYLWKHLHHAKRTSRAATILDLAEQIFPAVEVLAIQQGWTGAKGGDEKWKKFVSLLFDALKASGQKEPTGKEMEQLKQWVYLKATGDKLPRLAKYPAPLPG